MQRSEFRLVILTALCLVSTAFGENWPHWRGPTNNGISHETGLPAHWSETHNIAWKLALPGAAGSTPIVWGKKIFLTSQDGENVVLLCIDTSGKQLWKRPFG